MPGGVGLKGQLSIAIREVNAATHKLLVDLVKLRAHVLTEMMSVLAFVDKSTIGPSEDVIALLERSVLCTQGSSLRREFPNICSAGVVVKLACFEPTTESDVVLSQRRDQLVSSGRSGGEFEGN